jgi:hypothetical protein
MHLSVHAPRCSRPESTADPSRTPTEERLGLEGGGLGVLRRRLSGDAQSP